MGYPADEAENCHIAQKEIPDGSNEEKDTGSRKESTTQRASSMSASYRFALDDASAWRKHLHEEGYVVLSEAMTPKEVRTGKDLLWTDLEAAHHGLSRNDSTTWKNWRLSPTGLDTSVVQDPGAWYVRACPGVKRAFEEFWETPELIVSMDAVILWRPWWIKSSWKPVTEGLHLDQNPFHKPDLETIQGMVPLLPVSTVTGGLQVIPRSHTEAAKTALKEDFPHLATCGDWCPLMSSHESAVLLLAEPGDLILWDSRTIHGGHVGTGAAEANDELARMSVTVCMVPRSRATTEVLEARRQGFLMGKIFNHAPHEAGSSTGTLRSRSRKRHCLEELTAAQQALL
eukprot:symbB.v1.2.009735.t1/scaffold625.1/size179458/12